MALAKRKRTVFDMIDDYFEDMQKWAEHFGEIWTAETPSWNLRNCSIEPLREITVTPTEVLLTVDLPYTLKDSVKVKSIGASGLEVSAQMKKKVKLDDLGVKHCKGVLEKFHCHVRIPVQVDMGKMNVHYKKGILEIRLPRKH